MNSLHTLHRIFTVISLLNVFDGILFVTSLKVFPFGWHLQTLYTYLRYFYFSKRENTSASTRLFQLTYMSTTTPLGEIDIFGHKSNSTYFADIDHARAKHIYYICRTQPALPPDENPWGRFGWWGAKKVHFCLGGVTCTFRREIKPSQRLVIRTQILSWDRKWVYLLSQFVSTSRKKGEGRTSQPVVYAASISKIVFKQGRRTVPPTEFFQTCGLIPIITESDSGPESWNEVQENRSRIVSTSPEEQTELWNAIEGQRVKGLGLAKHVMELDEALPFSERTGQAASIEH